MMSPLAFAASNKSAARQFTSPKRQNADKEDHELNVGKVIIKIHEKLGEQKSFVSQTATVISTDESRNTMTFFGLLLVAFLALWAIFINFINC